ncbi:Serine/threonine protein kinase [Enhygromyxa salina]|uniref:Serine/threonine protein kinase n=1 Tax=Enhygromyxa salina TaxID=215803 RepID=A0A0C2CYY3_9BACT|nr:protein kinase [Enhygromyxa salina]KIG13072.1 Serine/threonine protein kinase [Enhygromyxa salina]
MAADDRVSTKVGGGALKAANVELAQGDIVNGRYRLEQFLSSGGMGRVWQATDLDLRREVAIKLMHPGLVATQTARERFLREAQAAARLRSANVVSILDVKVDSERGVPYLTMELLRGEDLSRRLERGALSHAQTVAVINDVCAAITEAHAKGIIHRDLKPANIFLLEGRLERGRESVAKVLDFGIVKSLAVDPMDRTQSSEPRALTMAGTALGTVTYMSPEQAEDAQNVDHRADLWSIAAVCFECLTGKRAFRAKSLAELIRETSGARVVPSTIADNLPRGFDAWFAQATHHEIDRRFGTVAQLLEGLVALGKSQPAAASVQAGASLPPPSRSWASDANQIDINELRLLTFKNNVVTEFLESGTKYFVVGSKGLGKTLLLTYKRSLLHEQYQGGDERKSAAVKFIPEGRPYLDLMSDLPSVGKAETTLMSELHSCKRMWAFAFRVAALSHHAGAGGSSDERDELLRFAAPIRAMLEGRKAEPTVVIKQLLALSFGELKQMLDRSESFLEYKIRSLHSPTFMFVDKLDQALRQLPRQAWIAMQAGMIEAAWDLMSTNAHVKVFATIREEAFAEYESDIKANLHGATTALRYTKRDLEDMLGKLTYFYERVQLRDFVRLDHITTTRGARGERPFDFIYRHTLGRPRDLVIIASEISRNRGAPIDEQQFKRVIRETSAGMLVANVFLEMRVFLEILRDRDERGRFLALLHNDILTPDDLVDVWCRFHGFEREYYDLHGREADGVYHPFRELFDCGLLGVVVRDPATGRRSQHFRQPRDAVGGSRRQLPPSPHYLLHPALQALAQQLAGGGGFVPFRHVVIGHQQPWPSYYGRMIEVQRELQRGAGRGDEDSEDAVFELLARFDAHVGAGESIEVARHLVAATSAFAELTARLERRGWDDLHLALLELFPPRRAASPPRGAVVTPPRSPEGARELVADEPSASRDSSDPPDSSDQLDHEDHGDLSGPDTTMGPTHRAAVAMLLIDIVASTEFVEHHGDTMLVEFLRDIRDVLTHESHAAPRVIKGVGDGYLVVYDSVTGALAGARALLGGLQDRSSLRLVVHCGEVHVGAADVYGAEVHRLFRLEKIAERTRVGPPGGVTLPTPGRVMLSAAAVEALPESERTGFERVGTFRIKGFEDPAEVWVECGEA